MAKTKTKKESSTTAKIKELTGVKPEKVTEEQLNKIQSSVDRINQTHINIGQLEARKHQALHYIAGANDELTLLQNELQEEYGTHDVNIQDGVINYPQLTDANGEVNS